MATFFSDHFHSTGTGATTRDDAHIPSSGIDGAVVRYKRMRASFDSANADQVRFGSLPSTARIMEMHFGTDGAASAGNLDVGLAEAGVNHDGSVIDNDLFATQLDLTSAADYTDVFEESTTLEELDRGKPLWQLADEGGGTYSEDPAEQWDIIGTTDTGTDAVTEVVLHVRYVVA